ncbi:MAG: ATP-binding protein [Pseudomonadota bacterium]
MADTQQLRELDLVDAAPEQNFDSLTELAAHLLNVPVALVSIVDFDQDRQFFKSQHGLQDPWRERRQTPLDHSFCQHVVGRDCPLVVDYAPSHELVKDNLAIPNLGVMAYLGTPIYGEGEEPVGAFCVIADEPREWTEKDQASVQKISSCVSDLIRLKAARMTSERLRLEQQEFTNVLSHDLKAPTNTLALLHTELGLLLESDKDSEALMMLERCHQTTGRMNQLIEDVMSYTRVSGTEVDKQSLDLAIVVNDVIDDLAQQIQVSGATVSAGKLPRVVGVASQLRILFQNLIGNGLKYVAPGVAPKIEIAIGGTEGSRECVIDVKDNGIGIDPEDHGRIFGMFKRLHLASEYSGTGIGLALCRRVALNHAGNIDVHSRRGGGSVFSVTLPVATDG